MIEQRVPQDPLADPAATRPEGVGGGYPESVYGRRR
jgi:hypothetical protein